MENYKCCDECFDESSREQPHYGPALTSGQYSDLEIHCEKLVLKVHRVIICTRSKPFAAMINGDFLEAKTGNINLPNDDQQTVSRMVEFIYFNRYLTSSSHDIQPSTSPSISAKQEELSSPKQTSSAISKTDFEKDAISSKKEDEEALIAHAKVYAIAEKYQMEDLKYFSHREYCRLAWKRWTSPSFIKSLDFLLENTLDEDPMREHPLVHIVTKFRHTLLKNPDFCDILSGHPDLSLNMLREEAFGKQTMFEILELCCNNCNYESSCPFCRSNKIFYKVSAYEAGKRHKYRCANTRCNRAFTVLEFSCDTGICKGKSPSWRKITKAFEN